MTAPVKIGKGSWIAAGCMILPGVTIGENSVVAIGSVVIRDVQPYSVVMGNPAKFIKKLERNQASEWQQS
jgi:acetyltransferase-like isoleucine patch superfamily enzyme